MRLAGALCLGTLLAIEVVVAWAQPALDRLGDPLPEGAIQRLGTTRMKGPYTANDYLPDGRGVLALGTNIELWNLATGERLETISVARTSVHSLRVSRNGNRLLFRDGGDAVEWSLAERRELHRIATGQPGFARPSSFGQGRVEYSPDETRVLTVGSPPPSVKQFELATGRELLYIDGEGTLTGERGQATFFTHAIYDPEGKTIFVVGGHDYCVVHFDLATGELLHRFFDYSPPWGHHAYEVHLSSDGERLLVGSRAYATEWLIDGYKLLQTFDGGAPGTAYTHDPDEILTGTRDGEIRRWNRHTGELLMQQQRYFGQIARFVTRLRLSPDGRHVLACGPFLPQLITESEVATGKPRQQWDTHDAAVQAVTWLPNRAQVVSGAGDGTLRLWDALSGRSLLTIDNPEPDGTVAHVALAASPDGTRLAAGCFNGVIREFSLTDGSLIRRLEGHSGYIRALAYSPDGRRLISAADDGTVRVWVDGSADPVAVLEGHRGGVLALALSPDGTRAATGGHDETVRVWDLQTGRLLHKLRGHRVWVSGLGFADATTLVSAGADRRIICWDLGTGEIVAQMEHGSRIDRLVVSADGSRAYGIGADRRIVAWDLARRQQVGDWPGHEQPVTSLALSDDGSLLVSGSADTTLLVWRVHQ